MESPDVFICHSGTEKKEFVDVLRILLQKLHKLKVFVDEWGLEYNDDAPAVMQQRLETAAVGGSILVKSLIDNACSYVVASITCAQI